MNLELLLSKQYPTKVDTACSRLLRADRSIPSVFEHSNLLIDECLSFCGIFLPLIVNLCESHQYHGAERGDVTLQS